MDHEQDIEETQEELAKGSDPEVRADARKELPVLRQHLAIAKRAEAAAG